MNLHCLREFYKQSLILFVLERDVFNDTSTISVKYDVGLFFVIVTIGIVCLDDDCDVIAQCLSMFTFFTFSNCTQYTIALK